MTREDDEAAVATLSDNSDLRYSMVRMHRLVPDPEKRDDRLAQAWHAFVSGRAGREDADLIMGDLAMFTGFMQVSDVGATDAELRRFEGRRDVMARILFLLDMPMSHMTELRRAAADEAVASAMEGR